MNAIVEARDLTKRFPAHGGGWGRRAQVHAVEEVDISLAPGEVVGLVGESGSGKSTLGRLILRLIDPTSGRIRFEGEDITDWSHGRLRPLRRRMQIIFQDPFSSLDPRKSVAGLIGEAYAIHGLYSRRERRDRIVVLLERVGLSADYLDRLPHEFSGGQRQRLGIARALAVEPRFIVADEPVSALDVSVQAQIINLMAELQRDLNLALLFISHDLSVVEYISDRVMVMYLGRIMEEAPARELYAAPRHPYTEALLSAAPVPEPDRESKRIILEGDLPSPLNPPSGCVFRTRCPYTLPACAEATPPLREVSLGRRTACIRDDVPSAAHMTSPATSK
ncbi:MAG: ABC transporter ATP-binding protein [Thiotrichales bacterium]|nr:ABC transporter ATP-binding protein [Thiotrichales bacterium]